MTTLQDVLLELQDSDRAVGYLGDQTQRYSTQDMMINHAQERVLARDSRYLHALMQETQFGRFLEDLRSINLEDPTKFADSVKEIAQKHGCSVREEKSVIIVYDNSGVFSELRLPKPPKIEGEFIGTDKERNIRIYTSPNPEIIYGQWRNAVGASYADCYIRNVNNPNLVLTLASRQMIEKALANSSNPLQGLILNDLRGTQGGGRGGYSEGAGASGYLGNQGWYGGTHPRERAYQHQREMTDLRFEQQRQMLDLRQTYQRQLSQEDFERRIALNYINNDIYADRKRIDALYATTMRINNTYVDIWKRATFQAINQFNNRRRSPEQNAVAGATVLTLGYAGIEFLGPAVARRAGQTPRVLAREGFGDPWTVRYRPA